MSELQLALLGAGVVAIAGVWVYNLWQDRKHRKAAEKLFKGDQPDVLLKDAPAQDDAAESRANAADESDQDMRPSRVEPSRIEPSIGERVEPVIGESGQERVAASSREATSRDDDDLAEAAPVPARAAYVAAPTSPEPERAPAVSRGGYASTNSATPATSATYSGSGSAGLLDDVSPADSLADCVVRFSLSAPVPAANVWKAQQVWSSVITKAITWLGRNPGEMMWRPVDADSIGRYSDWLVALQLADRNGAVSDIELRQFFTGIDGLGQLLGIGIDVPERVEVLLRAQSLDSFCAGVDVQFSIHVVESSGGTFPGTKLRGVCEAAGLSLGTDGCFHSVDDNGLELFRLSNIGPERFAPESIRSLAAQGVTLTIDVPRVADGTVAFNRMITTAQQLARGLGGVLVDVQRAPLADAMISMIRAKIIELQQQMREADIPPGSPRALKLFS